MQIYIYIYLHVIFTDVKSLFKRRLIKFQIYQIQNFLNEYILSIYYRIGIPFIITSCIFFDFIKNSMKFVFIKYNLLYYNVIRLICTSYNLTCHSSTFSFTFSH
jgi:hypothetical protein